MSASYFLIAAPVSVEALAEAVLAAWPGQRRVGEAEYAADERELGEIVEAGDDALVLHRDGEWAVLEDLSGVRAESRERLAAVSERCWPLVSLVHQDSVGFFQLLCFERGRLVREETTDVGTDAGVGGARAAGAMLDAAWRSFGLRAYWEQAGIGAYTIIRYAEGGAEGGAKRRWWGVGRNAGE